MERDGQEILRKAVHMSAPLFASAYLIPEGAGWESRDVLMIALWAAFGLFEIYRIRAKVRIPGLREYEYRRPSAAFWMFSAFLPMILFFPVDHSLPLLVGFALTDPLIGVLRKRGSRMYPILPSLLYFAIMTVSLSLSHGMTYVLPAVSAAVTVSAIAAESIRNETVDDDFLMLIVPLAVLWVSGGLL